MEIKEARDLFTSLRLNVIIYMHCTYKQLTVLRLVFLTFGLSANNEHNDLFRIILILALIFLKVCNNNI